MGRTWDEWQPAPRAFGFKRHMPGEFAWLIHESERGKTRGAEGTEE